MFTVGRERSRHFKVNRKQHLLIFFLGKGDELFGHVNAFFFDKGFSQVVPLGSQEGIGQPAANKDDIRFFNKARMTPILSATLAPPTMAAKGRTDDRRHCRGT